MGVSWSISPDNGVSSSDEDIRPRWHEYLGPVDVPQEGRWHGQWKETVLHLRNVEVINDTIVFSLCTEVITELHPLISMGA